MPQAMITYKLQRDQVEHHLELLRAVYRELESDPPHGLHWATFQLEDGVSFVDIVTGDGPAGQLSKRPAFRRYRSTLDERCEQPPALQQLHEVGSFRFH